MPRTLGEVNLALINTNYALDAKLDPIRDSLVIEDARSPYVNFVVGRPGSENGGCVVKLIAALHSDAARRFISLGIMGLSSPRFDSAKASSFEKKSGGTTLARAKNPLRLQYKQYNFCPLCVRREGRIGS